MGWFSNTKDNGNSDQKEKVHDRLDKLGYLPVIGAIFDFYNGALYAWEEDALNAALSGIAAMPGIGDIFAYLKNSPKISKEMKKFMDIIIGLGKGKGKVKDGAKAGKKLNAKELLKKIKKKIKEIIGGEKGPTPGGKSSPDGGKPKKPDKPKGGLGAGKSYKGTRNPDLDFVNGKGKSTVGKHSVKHGYTSPDDYLKDARNFLEKKPTQTTQTFVSSEGTYFRYDTATNEFGIINQYGGVSTYFKPDDGIDYWIEQIKLYKPK